MGIVAVGILAAGRTVAVVVVGMVVVVVVVNVVDRLADAEQLLVAVGWQRGAGNKRQVAAAAVGAEIAVMSVVAAAEALNVSAAAGVDGGAKNEASMRPVLRLKVGKKSSSRRPGQLGSGQRQTGQNMNKIGSDFGRRPGCGTS